LLLALTCSALDMRSTSVVQPHVSHMISATPCREAVGNGSVSRALLFCCDLLMTRGVVARLGLYCLGAARLPRHAGEAPWCLNTKY
jgi:hypothetical protein